MIRPKLWTAIIYGADNLLCPVVLYNLIFDLNTVQGEERGRSSSSSLGAAKQAAAKEALNSLKA